jgi:hypothetical protein
VYETAPNFELTTQFLGQVDMRKINTMEEDATSFLRDIMASPSDSEKRIVFAATYLTIDMTRYKILEDGHTCMVLLG